jgi:hypothetical protein
MKIEEEKTYYGGNTKASTTQETMKNSIFTPYFVCTESPSNAHEEIENEKFSFDDSYYKKSFEKLTGEVIPPIEAMKDLLEFEYSFIHKYLLNIHKEKNEDLEDEIVLKIIW